MHRNYTIVHIAFATRLGDPPLSVPHGSRHERRRLDGLTTETRSVAPGIRDWIEHDDWLHTGNHVFMPLQLTLCCRVQSFAPPLFFCSSLIPTGEEWQRTCMIDTCPVGYFEPSGKVCSLRPAIKRKFSHGTATPVRQGQCPVCTSAASDLYALASFTFTDRAEARPQGHGRVYCVRGFQHGRATGVESERENIGHSKSRPACPSCFVLPYFHTLRALTL